MTHFCEGIFPRLCSSERAPFNDRPLHILHFIRRNKNLREQYPGGVFCRYEEQLFQLRAVIEGDLLPKHGDIITELDISRTCFGHHLLAETARLDDIRPLVNGAVDPVVGNQVFNVLHLSFLPFGFRFVFFLESFVHFEISFTIDFLVAGVYPFIRQTDRRSQRSAVL